jgi:acetyltransferase-like isoleucine patch superfamily enzyme
MVHRSAQQIRSAIARVLCALMHKHNNAQCILAPNAVLHDSARVFNGSSIRESIVVGDYSHIRGELYVFPHGGKIEIGNYCYVGHHTHIWSALRISIGDRVLIAHNCNIFDNDTHPISPLKRHEHYKAIIATGHPRQIDLNEKEIVIQEDVWIAAGSTILKGVVIGRCAIVSAGSVVTRDVPPYTIVAGNPALVVRELSDDERM